MESDGRLAPSLSCIFFVYSLGEYRGEFVLLRMVGDVPSPPVLPLRTDSCLVKPGRAKSGTTPESRELTLIENGEACSL